MDPWTRRQQQASDRSAAWRPLGAYRKTEDFLPYLAALSSGARIVEIGAGAGRYVLPLIDLGYRVDAFDLSAGRLEILASHLKEAGLEDRCRLVHGDIFDPDLALERDYQAVLFAMTLHHFENQDKIADALRKARGLLRPGGRLVALEPNGDNPLWRLNLSLVRAARRGKSSTWEREKGIRNCRAAFFRSVLVDLFGEDYELNFHHIVPFGLLWKSPRGYRAPYLRFLATHLSFCGRKR